MTFDFSQKTESDLIAERSALLAQPTVDASAVRALESEAVKRLNAYLAGAEEIDSDDAPLFYGFIKVFSETDDAALRLCAKKAEAKITPLLKRFDRDAGFDDLADLTAETVERNIADLDSFERIDPFEHADGKLVLPQFAAVERVLDNVEIVDDDGNADAESGESFKETVVETARIKTYMRLCVSETEITRETYLDLLQAEMEKALVVLFMMDKTSDALPLDAAKVEQIHSEFQKLLDVLD